MTRIYDDYLTQQAAQKAASEAEQRNLQVRSDGESRIRLLELKVAELEKTVTGLKNVEKGRWQNLINRLKD